MKNPIKLWHIEAEHRTYCSPLEGGISFTRWIRSDIHAVTLQEAFEKFERIFRLEGLTRIEISEVKIDEEKEKPGAGIP